MASRRVRRSAASLLICVPLLVTGCASRAHEAGKAKSPKANGRGSASAPVVMFLGDSYTVGEKRVQPETTYAAATARLLGWQVVQGGRSGTGFVNPSSKHTPFDKLFEDQLGWRPPPALLVVSGGHNDGKYPAGKVSDAARTLLQKIRSRWPKTRIVLIGPMWGSDHPSTGALAVRDGLRTVASQLKIPFIDPFTEKWITGDRDKGTGNAARYIKPDGTHPTLDGHRYLATRLAEDLRKAGLAHPAGSS
ncbi:SGNH/GDSL hydrolase family protein [Actinomadura harenae]|uniref:SGNH/GDSL hydrolase family protein n=1 Tax=Actinomadura harenae TaxID=2483351 RepID=A0A3M2M2E0_9ACTN|nr:SGNH/GDSL hydrolase family protein [Actinomadura harenae]RMI43769.1 SGNH/GDSL hydrolase family protein [Actinomadura harenae]